MTGSTRQTKVRLADKVRATIVERELTQPGDRILVAVSGGIDSVVLLHLLSDMSQALGVTVHAAHLNHQLRGPESDADEDFVRGLADELGVHLLVERADVRSKAGKDNIEEVAREVRMAFLCAAAEHVRAGKIALGHTADDQVETFLINLFRGSGLDGLMAMPYAAPGGVVRPLLDVWRSEIAEHAAREGIAFREDSSNLDTGLLRNRIRHRLLPALAKEYNPQVCRRIRRTIELLRADADVLSAVARKAYERVAAPAEGGLLLDVGGFAALEIGMARRVARMALEEILGTLHDVESVHIETLVVRIAGRATGRLQLPGAELELTERGDSLLLSKYIEPPQAPEFEYELTIPGTTKIPQVDAAIIGTVYARSDEIPTDGEETQVAIDPGRIEGVLVARSRRHGDKIAPLGMGGHTKLVSDVLTDRKVPPEDRACLCVVCDSRKVVWLAGHAVSELVKVTPQTRKTLVLRLVCGPIVQGRR